jgi:hypothetical protein
MSRSRIATFNCGSDYFERMVMWLRYVRQALEVSKVIRYPNILAKKAVDAADYQISRLKTKPETFRSRVLLFLPTTMPSLPSGTSFLSPLQTL